MTALSGWTRGTEPDPRAERVGRGDHARGSVRCRLLLVAFLVANCGGDRSGGTTSTPSPVGTSGQHPSNPRTDAATLGRALDVVHVPGGRRVGAPADPRLLNVTPTQPGEPLRQLVRWWSLPGASWTPDRALRAVTAALAPSTAYPRISGRITGPDLLVVSRAFTNLPGQAPETMLTIGAARSGGMRRTVVYAAATAYPAPVYPVRLARPVLHVRLTADHLDVPPAQYTGAAARAFARAVDELTAPVPGPRSCPAPEIGAPTPSLTLTIDTAQGPMTVVVRVDGCPSTSVERDGRIVAANLDGGWRLLDLARRLASAGS